MLSIHVALGNAVADALAGHGVLVPFETPIGPQQVMNLINGASTAV